MKRKRGDRRGYWRRIVTEFERSGRTQESFARSRKLNVWTFRTWLYRIRAEKRQKQPTAAPLVEVEVVGDSVTAVRDAVYIRTGNGVTVEFQGTPTPSYLAAVVLQLHGGGQ